MTAYEPEAPPITLDAELQEYLVRELARISAAVKRADEIVLPNTNVAPAKPEEGTILYADGVNFNPGSGEGVYVYINGAWVKLSLLSTDDVTIDDLTLDTIRITGTNEATLASTDHPFQIGPSNNKNLIADTDEIQARNNGAAQALLLNPAGGDVQLSATSILDLLGGQIKFPATQNASADPNVIDDVEKGVWTPVVAFGGVTTGITYTTQVGRYTKIGRLVLIEGEVLLSNKGAAVGAATISGIPFTIAQASASFGQAISGMAGLTAGSFLIGGAGTTILSPRNPNAAGSAAMTNAEFTNTSRFFIGGVYSV